MVRHIQQYYIMGMGSRPISDESVLCLGESIGQAKYKQDGSNVQRH